MYKLCVYGMGVGVARTMLYFLREWIVTARLLQRWYLIASTSITMMRDRLCCVKMLTHYCNTLLRFNPNVNKVFVEDVSNSLIFN